LRKKKILAKLRVKHLMGLKIWANQQLAICVLPANQAITIKVNWGV
jgi:hypothetical protein